MDTDSMQVDPPAHSGAGGGFNPNALGDEVLPFALLMDELKHEDLQVRLMAVKRLSTIALALGPDRARNELIPFLEDSTDDEDEVLKALAEELGEFSDCVGGPAYAHLLLPTLEALAATEETVVREAAVAAVGKIAAVLTAKQVDEVLVPLVKRLSAAEWFTSKVSACGLYAHSYPLAKPEVQEELRKFFLNLAHDDTPMVRRAAATEMPAFIAKLTPEHVKTDMFPIFIELSADDQDSVRLLTIPVFLALADRVDLETTRSQLVPTLLHLISDKSWRVRYMAANHYLAITHAVSGTKPAAGTGATAAAGSGDVPEIVAPTAHVDPDLVTAYVALLRDVEAEVRQAAAGQVPGFSGALRDPALVLSAIVPCVKELVSDANQHVRSAVAQHISGLAPILGKEATIEHLLALFLQLLKDTFSEVRLNLISKLESVNSVIGIELLAQSLLPAIVELAEDKQWRVRAAIIEYMPLLAQQLGQQFFSEKLGPLCMGWLGDPVFAIREAACVNLRNLSKVFGHDWTRDVLLPQIVAKTQEPNYLSRMTTVIALTTLAPTLPSTLLQSHVLPTLASLADDSIPNIRFNVAKAIEALSPVLQAAGVAQSLAPVLKKLTADSDADVRYFAQRASTTAGIATTA